MFSKILDEIELIFYKSDYNSICFIQKSVFFGLKAVVRFRFCSIETQDTHN